jgi:hypothetical protein
VLPGLKSGWAVVKKKKKIYNFIKLQNNEMALKNDSICHAKIVTNILNVTTSKKTALT